MKEISNSIHHYREWGIIVTSAVFKRYQREKWILDKEFASVNSITLCINKWSREIIYEVDGLVLVIQHHHQSSSNHGQWGNQTNCVFIPSSFFSFALALHFLFFFLNLKRFEIIFIFRYWKSLFKLTYN